MSAHTPGPWIFSTSPNCWTVLQSGSSGRWHIAGGTGWCISGKMDEAAANARLIAAAPEMLDALRKAVVLLAGACVHSPELEPQETYEAVSAAIANATGGEK